MNEFQIEIELVVTADSADDVNAMLADSGVDYGDITVRSFDHIAVGSIALKRWDVTMIDTVKSATVRTASRWLNTGRIEHFLWQDLSEDEARTLIGVADTITSDLRKALSKLDPNWHCIMYYDGTEILELFRGGMYAFDALGYRNPTDLNKELKGELKYDN